MKKTGSLRACFRRAFFSPAFFLAAAGVAAVLLGEVLLLKRKANNAFSAYGFAFGGGGVDMIIYMILPVLPFALSYAADVYSGAVPFWSVRCGIRRYVRGVWVTASLTGFCTVFFGILLFDAVLFTTMTVPELMEDQNLFGNFLKFGTPVPYLLVDSFYKGLSGAMTACIAVWFSSMVPDRLATIASPVVLDFLYIRVITIPGFFYDRFRLIKGINIEGGGELNWLWTILAKLATALVLCTVLGLLAEYNAKRRQKNE
ncbi:MAG: hypothetical protein PUC59_08025 [Firmicutes bacterium]|nr:hypothetical protein [Bacillota bacterium]